MDSLRPPDAAAKADALGNVAQAAAGPADNLAGVVIAQVQAMQNGLKEDQELVVLCTIGLETYVLSNSMRPRRAYWFSPASIRTAPSPGSSHRWRPCSLFANRCRFKREQSRHASGSWFHGRNPSSYKPFVTNLPPRPSSSGHDQPPGSPARRRSSGSTGHGPFARRHIPNGVGRECVVPPVSYGRSGTQVDCLPRRQRTG